MTQTQTHGGKRSGAGRPKQVDAPIRRTVYLDQKHITTIAMWQYVNRCTFSEALRQIIDEVSSGRVRH